MGHFTFVKRGHFYFGEIGHFYFALTKLTFTLTKPPKTAKISPCACVSTQIYGAKNHSMASAEIIQMSEGNLATG
jgi:hypothetical protein